MGSGMAAQLTVDNQNVCQHKTPNTLLSYRVHNLFMANV